jgi:hypothetical protein
VPAAEAWPSTRPVIVLSRAIVVPILQQGYARPSGAFVAGLNPYRPFDNGYRNVVGLVVGPIAAALSSARAYEDERRRASAPAELDRAKTAFFGKRQPRIPHAVDAHARPDRGCAQLVD